MGKRGPAPAPNIIQVAKGDPGKRAHKCARTEPSPPVGEITPPDNMDGEASKEWRRILGMFAEMERGGQRVITQADLTVLACYCFAWGDLCVAREEIRESGRYVKSINKSGAVYAQLAPWVRDANAAMAGVVKYGAEMGLSPSSRTRVSRIPIDKKDRADEEMFG